MAIRTKVLVTALASASITGCVHAPKVVYSEVPASPEAWASARYDFASGPIKFRLAGSMVAITASPPANAVSAAAKDDAKPVPKPMAAALSGSAASGVATATARELLDSLHQQSVPIADMAALYKAQPLAAVVKTPAGKLYALSADDPFYFRSNLSPQYVPGTFLLSSLGAAAEDNSSAAIQSAGTLIATAVTVFGFVGTPGPKPKLPLSLPLVIDLTAGSADTKGCWKSSPTQSLDGLSWCNVSPGGSSAWQYAVSIQEAPAGAMSASAFFSNAAADEKTFGHLFPVSACVPIALLLSPDPAAEVPQVYRFDMVVADPSLVYGVLIPAKGTISMPDVCGSNLTVNASGSPTDLDIASALIQQVAAIKKAGAPAANAAKPAASAASKGG